MKIVDELAFWSDNAKKLNINYIDNNATKKSNYVVYSHASSTGCGAISILISSEKVRHRKWDHQESQ